MKTIKTYCYGIILLLCSINSCADPLMVQIPREVKYECGKKCKSINKVIFELRAGNEFLDERHMLPSIMPRFNNDFQKLITDLKTDHKIKFNTGFRLDDSTPNFNASDNELKVFVVMKKDLCSTSKVYFEVVSMSVGSVGFRQFICNRKDSQCYEKTLSDIFEIYVVGYIKNSVAPYIHIN